MGCTNAIIALALIANAPQANTARRNPPTQDAPLSAALKAEMERGKAAVEKFLKDADANAESDAAEGGIGIAFAPDPFGAVILAVAPGSPADLAGLQPTEAVEAVNGVSIAGLEQNEIEDLLDAAGRSVTLTLFLDGDVVIQRDIEGP